MLVALRQRSRAAAPNWSLAGGSLWQKSGEMFHSMQLVAGGRIISSSCKNCVKNKADDVAHMCNVNNKL